jgi:hypothetical protein
MYDFICTGDGKISEQFFHMNDIAGRNTARCPECGFPARRILNVPSTSVKIRGVESLGLKPNQAVIDHDGRPIVLNFVDHGDNTKESNEAIGKIGDVSGPLAKAKGKFKVKAGKGIR